MTDCLGDHLLDRVLPLAVPHILASMRNLVHRDPEVVLEFWKLLSGFLWYHGRIPAYVRCDLLALQAAERLSLRDPHESLSLQAIIARELAAAFRELGDYSTAEIYTRRAEHIFRDIDPNEVATILLDRATLRYRENDLAAAKELVEHFLTLADAVEVESDDGYPIAQRFLVGTTFDHVFNVSTRRVTWLIRRGRGYNLLGSIASRLGNHQEARRHFLLALGLVRPLPHDQRDYYSLAPLRNLARNYERVQAQGKAWRCYRRLARLTAKSKSHGFHAAALFGMARLMARGERFGDQERARGLAIEAAAIYEENEAFSEKARVVRFLQDLADRQDPAGSPANTLPMSNGSQSGSHSTLSLRSGARAD